MDRVETGRAASKRGDSFEDELAHANGAYLRLGIAKVRKLPVPTRATGPRNRVVIARQGYDFQGTFGPAAGPGDWPSAWHGLSIAMESKITSKGAPSLPIKMATSGKKRGGGSGLGEHQLKALAEEYRDFGAASCVVWRNGDAGLVLTPDKILETWLDYEAGGRKSIPKDRFETYDVVPYPDAGEIHDWLYTLRVWLERHGRPAAGLSTRKPFEMVNYDTDHRTKELVVTVEGNEVRVKPLVFDEREIQAAAREAKSPNEFVELVKRIGFANE